jgi:hypothetical protein
LEDAGPQTFLDLGRKLTLAISFWTRKVSSIG